MAKYGVVLLGHYDNTAHGSVYPGDSVRYVEADFMECANGAVLFYQEFGDPPFIVRKLIAGFPLSVVLTFSLEEKGEDDQ